MRCSWWLIHHGAEILMLLIWDRHCCRLVLSHLLILFDGVLLVRLDLLNLVVSMNAEHPLVALVMTLLLFLRYLVASSRRQEVHLAELLKLHVVVSCGHLMATLVHRELSQKVLVYDFLFRYWNGDNLRGLHRRREQLLKLLIKDAISSAALGAWFLDQLVQHVYDHRDVRIDDRGARELWDLLTLENLSFDILSQLDLVLFILLVLGRALVECPKQLEALSKPVSESAELDDLWRLWHANWKAFILYYQGAQHVISGALWLLQQQNLRRLQLGAVYVFEIVIELFGLWTNSHLSLDFGLPSFDRFRNELKLRHFFKL